MFVCIQFTNHIIKMAQEDHEGAQGVRGWGGRVGSSLCISQSSFSVICCLFGLPGRIALGFWTSLKMSAIELPALIWRLLDWGRGLNSSSLNPFSPYQGAGIHRGQQRVIPLQWLFPLPTLSLGVLLAAPPPDPQPLSSSWPVGVLRIQMGPGRDLWNLNADPPYYSIRIIWLHPFALLFAFFKKVQHVSS